MNKPILDASFKSVEIPTLEEIFEVYKQIVEEKCRSHPKYKGERKPRANCEVCRAIFHNKHPGE